MKDKKIGIIGAGVMGRGVAQRFATYGYNVYLIDIVEDVLKKAENEIRTNIRFMTMMKKVNVDVNEVMERIHYSTTYDILKDVDYVIENIPEKAELKKALYLEISKICREAIYLVNTSCISITDIGSYTRHPENVIGVHFMNPVPMKNFAEVIRGYYTTENTIGIINELLNSVEITCEIVNDSVGFVSNRVSHLYMNEAAWLVYEGVATAEQVDNIFKKGFGHTMGPLETADLIGIDTVVDSLEIIYNAYQDSKFRVCPLLKKMVSARLLGKKSGKGFYTYQ